MTRESLFRKRPRNAAPASELERRLADFPALVEPFACDRLVMRVTRPHSDFPFTIGIFHRDPDPFDYRIAARTASDAAAIVARMRALGRGAWIAEVNA